ncbi:hypothetical protein DFP72DRAFT_902121 [Ephemerocybe angulata]|uniref:F-box domain-containing protein n=1 Tax=Ephemerocybe angulata TaxID=980116 RepID=A0A8H6HU01_9AGAR|nr:hypothetical protein DFP72DRAFT_902121 [Tulosesus angulatus]
MTFNPSSTPFAQHLNTNYVPSNIEIPRIRALVQENNAALAELIAQIEALEVVRVARASFGEQHMALLSPVKRLPDDILSTLFLTLLAHPDHRDVSMSSTHPAVVISHVCGRWRQLALNTPLLWSSLTIHPPVAPRGTYFRNTGVDHHSPPPRVNNHQPLVDVARRWEKELERIKRLACIWLERSKECDLYIDFHACDPMGAFHQTDGHTGMGTPPATMLASLADIICDTSPRWKGASLRITNGPEYSGSAFYRMLNLKPEDVPRLRRLSLYASFRMAPESPGNEQLPTPPDKTTGMLGGVSLRTLTLGSISVHVQSLPIRWEQLTDLQFDGYIDVYTPHTPSDRLVFDFKQALSLLERCPHLVTCDLSLAMIDVELPDSRPAGSISLPHLKSLTLRYSVPGPHFVTLLSLPSLEVLMFPNYLDINVPQMNCDDGIGPVESWLQAFGHNLKEVQINVANLKPSGLLRCMDLLPNIVFLHLDHSGDRHTLSLDPTFNWAETPDVPESVDGDFLRRLTPLEENDIQAPSMLVPCPRLEVINFPKHGGITFTERELLDFIAGRRRTCVALKSPGLREVTAAFETLQELDITAALKEEGVDIVGLTLKVLYPRRIPLQTRNRRTRADYDSDF